MVLARLYLNLYPLAVLGQEYLPAWDYGTDYGTWDHAFEFNPYMQQQPNVQLQPDFKFDPYMQQQPIIEMPYTNEYMDESCQAQQAKNIEETGLPELNIGQVHCAQAGDGRWWDITILHHGCDGTYAAQVKDEALTFWPIVHRSLILDEPCTVYEALAKKIAGESEDATDVPPRDATDVPPRDATDVPPRDATDVPPRDATDVPPRDATDLPPRDATDLPPRDTTDLPPRDLLPRDLQKTEKPTMPVAPAKKVPWRVVGAAATAGAVPLLFGLTGAASGAAA